MYHTKKTLLFLSGDGMLIFNVFFVFINIIGALSLIQYCLKPDPNTRATTKDILRHDWLAHGPVLSLRLNSTKTSSTLSLADQQSHNDYDKVRLRTPTTPTTINDKSISPTNSLVELELHTSSFFDTTRLRDNSSNNNTNNNNKEQQRRNRVSAIPISTRYLTSNNSKTNSITSSRPTYHRRPVSLSFDDQSSANEPSQIQHQRPVSPTIATHRYTLADSSATPSSSYDLDSILNDLKSKRTPPENKLIPTTIAPSVFTTSAIKFAPPPARRRSPYKDHDTNINNPIRLLNNTISNPSSNINDSIDIAPPTNHNNRRSLLTSLDIPSSTTNNLRKSRLLDDNNNFISLKVHD